MRKSNTGHLVEKIRSRFLESRCNAEIIGIVVPWFTSRDNIMGWSCGSATALVSPDASLHSYIAGQHITVLNLRGDLLDVRCLHTVERRSHCSQLLALRSLSY